MMKNFIWRNKTIILVLLALIVGFWWGSRPRVYPLLGGLELPKAVPETLDIEEGFGGTTRTELAQKTSERETEAASSPSERLIIKSASLSILVKDVRESVASLSKLAESLGGFVTHSSISEVEEKEGQLRATVTLRVAAEKFTESLNTIKAAGLKVKSENISGQDVTEEYTDLQSRLKNLEVTEEQLLQIMKRAGSISDVLEVQKELNIIRGQIEQTKGRIKYLEESAKLSSITVYLATEEEELPIVEERWRPIAAAKAGLRALVSFWQAIADHAIYWAIFLSPFITISLLYFFLKKIKSTHS